MHCESQESYIGQCDWSREIQENNNIEVREIRSCRPDLEPY